MAYSITNNGFVIQSSLGVPSASLQVADAAVAASSAQDTGIEGLKWVRARVLIKTLTALVAGEVATFSIQAGTGTAVTDPTTIAQGSVTMNTGDTALTMDVYGWSNAGFQSFKYIMATTSSHAVVYDASIEVG